jgi:nucleoside-diphosphate-sugar epimerase
MRVLVTGGAGFIGGKLTRALAARGDEVFVFDNLVGPLGLSALAGLERQVTFVHGDVRCPEDFARLGRARFDRVFHLAGSFANELSVEHPALDRRSNVDGTRHTLAFAHEVGCGLFVYTGTSSSYGDAPPPIDEAAPCRPQTPYARSKYEGEQCVHGSGLPFAVFRLFNVYGPGDVPGRYRNVIPNLMSALDEEGARLRVFGRDATRDFTYVDDVVDVLLQAERATGDVVNVGSGVETRVLDLAQQILALFGLPTDRVQVERPRAWDGISRRCASTTRLEQRFGFRPMTPLASGLERTARWLHAHGHVKRAVP